MNLKEMQAVLSGFNSRLDAVRREASVLEGREQAFQDAILSAEEAIKKDFPKLDLATLTSEKVEKLLERFSTDLVSAEKVLCRCKALLGTSTEGDFDL